MAARLTAKARTLPDTDWHVDRLYDFAPGLGVGVIAATHSRYVVDVNRAPDDAPLYPDADTTELSPLTDFDREPIYRPGRAPEPAEIARRIETYWRPYHVKLAGELERMKAVFGIALLLDAHSIRSRVPRFFEGRLPDLNLGTSGGTSADPRLARHLLDAARAAADYGGVLDGRFKGGYTIRHHGRPAEGIHAVQLELSQATYMDERPPYSYLPERAASLRPVLKSLIEALLDWGERQA